MKYIFSILLCLTLQFGFSQIVKTVGISYTNGTPTYTPAKAGSPIAIDTSTWLRYDWNGSAWIASGMRIQSISGCSAPLYTPSKYQSTIVVNNCTEIQGGPEIYVWNGIAWVQTAGGGGATYTAGDGIDITSDVISADTTLLATVNDLNLKLDKNASFGGDVSGTYDNLQLGTGVVGPTELANTAVTPGTYTYMTGTVDAQGRFTAASSGTTPVVGSISSGQVGYGGGSNTLTSSSNFTYSGTAAALLYNANNQNPIFTLRNSNAGNSASTRIWLYNDVSPSSSRGASIFLTNAAWANPYTNALGIWNYENGPILFTTNNSERMRLSNSGLSIGTTSTALQQLHVSGSAYISGSLGIGVSSPTVPLDVVGNVIFSGSQLTVNSGSTDIATYSTTNNVGRAVVNSTSNSGFSMKISSSEKWVMAAYKTSGTNYSFTFYNSQLSSDALFISGDNNNIGFGTNSPTSRIDISPTNGYSQLRLRSSYTPTGTADALGSTGDTAWDDNYFYIKTFAGWKRTALSTF